MKWKEWIEYGKWHVKWILIQMAVWLVNWTFQQHDERITMRIHEFIAGEELKCKSLRQKVKESAFATQTKRTECKKVRTLLLSFFQMLEESWWRKKLNARRIAHSGNRAVTFPPSILRPKVNKMIVAIKRGELEWAKSEV